MSDPGFTLDEQEQMVRALRDGRRWPHRAFDIEVVETHISWVILVGNYAYKLKKAVDYGFLDYSTLARRKTCCDEELRLNSRTAPNVYLETMAVGGTPDAPEPGREPAREWLVRMRRFPAGSLLCDHLASARVEPETIDQLAHGIARFHATVAVATGDSPFGSANAVQRPVAENFTQIANSVSAVEAERLEPLRRWSEQRFVALRERFAARKAAGFIRECHGDLHTGNIALLGGEAVPFDGIEFDPALRWIDVISEAAFLVMDLEERGRSDLAWRWLNHYLERSGDYSGLDLLRYYQAYRAMVRAKVTAIRRAQHGVDAAQVAALTAEYEGYVALAERYAAAPQPALMITRGVSGSGKSWGSQRLIEALGAIRVRSDVERKRLFGLDASSRAGASAPGGGIYASAASQRTYDRLLELARALLGAGQRVVVDATFLAHRQRAPFIELAERLQIPLVVLDFAADPELLRRRVVQRSAEGRDASDASLAVLTQQLANIEALHPEETRYRLAVPHEIDAAFIERVRERLG